MAKQPHMHIFYLADMVYGNVLISLKTVSAIHYSFYDFDFIYTTFCKPLLYEYMIPFFTAVKSFFTPFINV